MPFLDETISSLSIISFPSGRMHASGLSRRMLVEKGHEMLQKYKEMKESQPKVLCHSDTRINNFIINDETGNQFIQSQRITHLGENT